MSFCWRSGWRWSARRRPRRRPRRRRSRPSCASSTGAGSIDQATYDADRAILADVKRRIKRLTGTRRYELAGVLATTEGIAARGKLRASRLPPLFLQLQRNAEYWTASPLLSSGARVSFPGSELVFQYFPGQGLQLHPLANFGKLNAYAKGSKRNNARNTLLLDELMSIAVPRGGGLAWEYYFNFDGGSPPWVSGLAQGTGLQAIARSAVKLGRQDELFPEISAGLKLFEQRTPTGVRVKGPNGTEYAQYSFAPGLTILNGFIQSLVGLWDVADLTGDPRAAALFEAGDRTARKIVPSFDTGAWSLYSRGTSSYESNLSYHELLRDFLTSICDRTQTPVYCTTEQHFTGYLTTPPVLELATKRLRGGKTGVLTYSLSKISSTAISVTAPSGRTVLSVAAGTVGHGTRTVSWNVPRRAGIYTVRISATDLAGNRGGRHGAGRGAQAAEARVGSGALAPRTILYTGKGGVGKTSVAAATARRCAAAGQRTILLSTDPAGSLGDVLEQPVGAEPGKVAKKLWAQQVSAQDELERHWTAVQAWLGSMLIERGVERIAAEELTVPPGGDELFSLLRIRDHVEEGRWDVIVVDCAPTGETLRLLSFPEAARWWLGKLAGRETQLLAAARPFARAFLDLRLPDEDVLEEVNGLVASLVELHDILRDREHASVRLVMTPDRMVVAEAMRTFTYLSLYGYLTDGVIVNRIFPAELDGTYFGAWRERQQAELARVRDGFAPVPVLEAPYFETEVAGAAMLDRLGGALFAGDDASALLHGGLAREFGLGDGDGHVRLAVPFADRDDVSVKKVGDELVVAVEGRRRTVILPAALAALKPAGAALDDGALVVRFA